MKTNVTYLKYCLVLLFTLLTFSGLHAQVNMNLLRSTRNVNVKMTVKDKISSEPVGFATAYLMPKGDTTIIDFCLSDKDGKVLFKEIPAGSYEVNIEMMGYHPYKKVHKLEGWETDLGEIRLELNREFIRSALISAAANPIRIVEDTVEFTASAFRVGQNAMLEDLLKKMPGMEVENGKVKLNGQEIDRITVGGKTFFFNDQSAALKNLPARIVDKIKVIDREKDDAAFSGVATQEDKEKVMDVALKKAFQKGWFGNIAAAGGTNINPDQKNELMEKSGVVYNANGMVSGYNEKDQVVFLGNGQNVTDPSASMAFFSSSLRGGQEIENAYDQMGGLTSSAGGGVNWNTQRWKAMDIATAVKYDFTHKNDKRKSYRTSFQQEGPDLNSASGFEGYGRQHGLDFNLEMKNNNRKKYLFSFTPSINYKKNHFNQDSWSETRLEETPPESAMSTTSEPLNSNRTRSNGDMSIFSHGLGVQFGMANLGKQKRTVTFDVDYRYSQGNGSSHEITHLPSVMKDLAYQLDNETLFLSGRIRYTEPLSERWFLNTHLGSRYSSSNKVQDAFNEKGEQDHYYSSLSENLYLQENGSINLLYTTGKQKLQFGANVMATQNTIRSQSLGQSTESGQGKWDWKVSPSITYYLMQAGHRLNLFYSGWTSPVSADQVIPTLDFKDPLQIHTGNVYLKPYFSNQLYASYGFNNKKTFTYVNLDLHGNITLNGISNAIWFDGEGVRYAVPVNVKKPQMNLSTYLNFNQPFGKGRRFSFGTSLGVNYGKTDSYQATGILDGLDTETFDYNDFMSSFWGNAAGDRFYSGESGFAASNTHHINLSGNAKLKYTGDILDITLRQSFGHNSSRYSLNPDTNTTTWDFTSSIDLGIRPGKEWEILTDAGYSWYRGYAAGYGEPQFLWNLRINKSINAFTLSLSAIDLLNQKRNFRHNVSNEYIEDSYVNSFGRYITFGIAWNFGKKGANQNKNVQRAMFRMQ